MSPATSLNNGKPITGSPLYARLANLGQSLLRRVFISAAQDARCPACEEDMELAHEQLIQLEEGMVIRGIQQFRCPACHHQTERCYTYVMNRETGCFF